MHTHQHLQSTVVYDQITPAHRIDILRSIIQWHSQESWKGVSKLACTCVGTIFLKYNSALHNKHTSLQLKAISVLCTLAIPVYFYSAAYFWIWGYECTLCRRISRNPENPLAMPLLTDLRTFNNKTYFQHSYTKHHLNLGIILGYF